MPTALDVQKSQAFKGTTRRIFQLLSEMGTSADAIWPFAAQPFMRSSGPLVVGVTEEWHLGVHAVLEELVPESRIVWRIDNDGVDGTHGFELRPDGKQIVVTHRMTAELSDDAKQWWRRVQETHDRAIDGLFEKMTRVLKR